MSLGVQVQATMDQVAQNRSFETKLLSLVEAGKSEYSLHIAVYYKASINTISNLEPVSLSTITGAYSG